QYANNNIDAPTGGARTLTVTLVDGDGTANGGADTVVTTSTVTVVPVNDAPVLTATAGTLAYVENGAAVFVDPGITVTDADHAGLAWARVQIGAGRTSGDQLSFGGSAATGDIAGSFDAAT